MKICGLALALVLAIAGQAFAGDVHHEVEVSLWPESGRLQVTDRITLAGHAAASFTLAPGLEVESVQIDGRAAEVTRTGQVWQIAAKVQGGQEIAIRYGGELSTEPGAPPFLGAAGSFLPAGSGWLPGFDTGRLTFDVQVRVPNPYVAVVTGDLVREDAADDGYQAQFRQEVPGEMPSLFVGPYLIEEREAADARVRTYFYPEQAELAPLYLQQAAGYLRSFAGRIGDYPYRDFHIVAAPIPVGLGFPGLTYVAAQILPLPFMQTRSLAHEVLHSWWGNAVAVDYARGNWAEGLTTYMADYGLVAADDPAQAHAMRLEWLRDYAALPVERDVSLRSFVAKQHDAAQVIGYNKAAFVFHMLQQRSGSGGFDAAIRRFWQSNRGEPASWAELEAAFSDTLDQDLSGFFQQWVERAGAPRLRLVQATSEELDQGYRVNLQIAQGAPAYRLQVPIALETEAGTERFAAELEGLSSEITLLAQARPVAVTVDPDYDVFRRLAPSQAPPILRDVTLREDALVLVPSTASRLNQLASGLAARMMDGGAATASKDDPRVRAAPLLLIGLTGDVRRALAGLELPPTPASLAGRGSARVWTLRQEGRGPVLVVEADDEAALAALLRPLPHYGRNSYLVFDGAEVREQGIWPPGENPLRKPLA